jgi:hypothetical protein
MVKGTPGDEAETMTAILARYGQEGYETQFSSRPGGMVHCHACGEEEPAEQVPLEALHRCEGQSDPDDMAVVAALSCPACGANGTLVAGYGPTASPEDGEVLANLMDDREHSDITPGM